MNKIIVANWKMNMPALKNWRNFRAAKNAEVVICPPFPYLACFKFHVSSFKLGAQDCFWEEKGAYTGEVSPNMLKNLGVQYVIIGHSERRRLLGETDWMINKKVLSALRAGLKVILCVGEPLAVRRKGLPVAKRYVANQLRQDLKGIHSTFGSTVLSLTLRLRPEGSGSPSKDYILYSRLVIAYEPIWAIGTGRPDKPEEAAAMAKFIKQTLKLKVSAKGGSASGGKSEKLKVIYGGSVDGKNAKNFLQYEEIDGALVGGASLKIVEFKKILKATDSR